MVWIGSLLNFVALGLLWPGINQPLLQISADAKIFGVQMTLFEQNRSAIQSIDMLHNLGNHFAAYMVLLFSIIIPISKAVILMLALLLPVLWRYRAHQVITFIGKWSMVDVLLGGILVAYISVNTSAPVPGVANTAAQLSEGFYWFAAYCIISLAGMHMVLIASERLHRQRQRELMRSELLAELSAGK